jgi:DNA polymerase (family 10)
MSLKAELIKIDGIGEKLADDLIEQGLKKVSDLKSPIFVGKLPIETQYTLKYKPERSHSWDFIHSIVAKLPAYIHPAGSYRRRAAVIKDVDLVTTHSLQETVQDIKQLSEEKIIPFRVIGEYASGDKKRSMIIKHAGKYLRLDLFKTVDEELPFAMLHWTGSKMFNIRIRAHAKKRGYKLNQYGLFKISDGKKVPNIASERDILTIIGVTYKPPELRNG